MDDIKTPQITDDLASHSCTKFTWLLLVATVFIGAALIVMQRFMEPEMGRDSTYYLPMVDIWRNYGFNGLLKVVGNFWFPPLHLASIVLVSHTGLSPENSAVAVGIFFGALMPLVSFAIAHELFRDKRISLAAALFTALNPSIIAMAVQAQRDVPYLFFAGWCIFFLIASIRRQKWFYWCFAGIFFGISILIRYESAEFIPLLGIYFIIVLCRKTQKWQLLCRDMALFALSGLAAAILLLFLTGTLEYMAGSYYRYFAASIKMVQDLYNGGGRK